MEYNLDNRCQPADGVINNDGSPRSKYFGLWKDSWTDDSYMWAIGDTVYLSEMVPTKPMGKCRFAVIEHLRRLGYNIIIPNPSIFIWPERPSEIGFVAYIVKTHTGNVVAWKRPQE